MSGISIQSNIASLRAQNTLSRTQRGLEMSLQRLSTGYRINQAGDDAAGLAISENLRAETRSLNQAIRNANDGMSVLNTAEGAMNEIGNILVRMRELSVQSASDTLGPTERGYLNEEFDALKDEITRISKVTDFNGQKLIDGSLSASGLDFQIGTSNNDESKLTVSIANVDSDALGLVDSVGVASKENALAAMSLIDTAITTVSTQRAKLGAYGNRLQSTVNTLQASVENLTAANSRIRDVDVASETASYARSQVLVQAGVSMLAQANSSPMTAVRLLG